MPNREQIIIFSALGILALILGCKPKPTRELTLEEAKIVGTYEHTAIDGSICRLVFLDNGVKERYNNGIKEPQNYKWSIVDKELHLEYDRGYANIYRINPDNSLTYIGYILPNGERKDYLKPVQNPFKKIN